MQCCVGDIGASKVVDEGLAALVLVDLGTAPVKILRKLSIAEVSTEVEVFAALKDDDTPIVELVTAVTVVCDALPPVDTCDVALTPVIEAENVVVLDGTAVERVEPPSPLMPAKMLSQSRVERELCRALSASIMELGAGVASPVGQPLSTLTELRVGPASHASVLAVPVHTPVVVSTVVTSTSDAVGDDVGVSVVVFAAFPVP